MRGERAIKLVSAGFTTACQCRSSSSIASQLRQHAGSSDDSTISTVSGWVRSFRKQKNVTFAVVSDGSNVNGLQAVVQSSPDLNLSIGCAVTMRGTFVDSPGKSQSKEFRAESVTVVGPSDSQTYPIPNTKQGIPPPILRQNAHLRPRTRATAAMLRLRSEMTFAVHARFHERGFLQVQTPLITSSDCEGAGEVFRVVSGKEDAKGKAKAIANRYLTVSSQLHLEAIASSTPRVYTLSPAFRAELSDTARHLQEFWMLESEESFLSEDVNAGLDQVMDGVQDTVQAALSHVLRASSDDLAYFEQQTPEAISILLQEHERDPIRFKFEPAHGRSIQTEHEKYLAEQVFNAPVFVTHYPASQKPWYMLASAPSTNEKQEAHGEGTVACFDLLVPRLGELVGGSLREHRHDRLVDAMKRHGIDEKQYAWYVDLRRFGSTPHGGWGLGWERLVAFVTGLDNVRDCIAFPRATEGSRF